MEAAIKNFLKRRFLSRDIFEARKSKLYKVIVQTIFVGLLLAFPLVFQLYDSAIEVEMILDYVIMVYVGVIVLNIIFILAISLMFLMMNATAHIPFTFKEFYSFLSYCATIPSLTALIAGTAFNILLVYIVYNFGLVFLAYFVYQREQKQCRFIEADEQIF